TYWVVHPEDEPLGDIYDNAILPRYLFIGASLMTVGILLLLWRQLPDFFIRTVLWLRSRGRYQVRVVGMHNLPTDKAVIMATNCHRLERCMQVFAATDRPTRFIVLEKNGTEQPSWLLRCLAQGSGAVVLHSPVKQEAWVDALEKALLALR